MKLQNLSMRRRALLRFAGCGALAAAVLALPRPVRSAGVKDRFWTPAGMDVMDAIFTRRSIRSFTGEPMPANVLRAVLAAGMNAPSAKNVQPWRFVAFTKKESLDRIPLVNPKMAYAAKAGAAVLACSDENSPDTDREDRLLSVACCGQNMLLAAHALGWEGIWTRVTPVPELTRAWRLLAKLPDDILPVSLIVMGKTAEPLPPINRMDESKIHYETW